MAIEEPKTTKRYAIQPPSNTGRGVPPRKRRITPPANIGPSAVVERVRAFVRQRRQRREAKILDALATDAIREYRAGRTRNLRDYARERNIAIDDK